MALTFTECNVYSKKFNKIFQVETYEADGCIIISATSLKRVYEEIKASEGLTDSIISDVRNDKNGNIFYASVELTLKDRNGYCSTSIGEAMSGSLTTPIARMYPKITAYNRALTAAVIAYLQLPGKYYSEYSFSVETNPAVPANATGNAAEAPVNANEIVNINKNEVETEEVTENSKKSTKASKDKTKEEVSDETAKEEAINAAPEMPEDVIQDGLKTEEELESQLPFNDGPKALLAKEKAKTEVTLTKENAIHPESNVPEVKIPVIDAVPTETEAAAETSEPAFTFAKEETKTTEAASVDKASATTSTASATNNVTALVNEDMYIGIGKYAQTTIAEFRNLVNNGDAVANKMLTMIKNGKVSGTVQKLITDYIKATF